MVKVLTVGVFDILHRGHVELFRKAKALGDYLIVAVQDSDVVLKYKPNAELIYSTEERMYMVQSVRYVDKTMVYEGVDEIVKKIEFDILALGPDQNHAGFQNAMAWCREHGKEVKIVLRTEGVSSSLVKEEIKRLV